MRRWITIWLMLIVMVLSSCASSRPKYVARKEVPKVRDNKRQKLNMEGHIWILIMSGFVCHILNEDSN